MPLNKKDVEEIKSLITEQIKAVLCDEFLEEIAARVTKNIEAKLNLQFSKYDADILKLSKEICDLKKFNSKLELQMDKNEQFSRRKNIRIFGLKYEEGENTQNVVLDLFNNKMNLQFINSGNIITCHRVFAKNRSNTDKPPAVLVTCDNVNVRKRVLQNKKSLKSTGVRIKEDLTKYRLSIFEDAVKQFTIKNVWSYNGSIYVRCKDVVHRVDNKDEITTLI